MIASFSTALLLVLLAATPAHSGEPVVVQTDLGPITGLRGRDVVRFRGIPYAEPPVGERRFRSPEPVAPWGDSLGEGGLDATAFGHTCVQPEEAPWLTEQSEDCLTLNVWTRPRALRLGQRARRKDRSSRKRLPVMVFIHGGGWTNEGSSDAWYRGARLARNGVVVVTLNYRLGAFGFLHLAELGDAADAGAGNAGIRDQIAALTWVRDHIAAFGGDPARVTVFGESAGSMSVSTLLAAPEAAGLFHRAIAESGALNTVRTADHAAAVTQRVLDAAGASSAAELRALSTEALAQANRDVIYDVWFSDTLFGPVVDGVVLHEPPLHSIANGSAAGIDLMIGTTEDEIHYYAYLFPALFLLDLVTLSNLSSYLVDLFGGREGDSDAQTANVTAALASYLDRRPGSSLTDAGLAIATDVFFRVPSIRLADAQRAHDPDVWMWRFDWDSPIEDGRYGAMHGIELPFVFGNLAATSGFVGDDPPEKLVRKIQRAWTSFARTGDPNAHRIPPWPRYGEDRETMLFDVKPKVVDDPNGEDRAYWDSIPFDGLMPSSFDIR